MNSDLLREILTSLYGVTGIALLASYAPQIRSVWRSKTGAADVSLFTWCLWCAASSIAALYAHFVASDGGYFLMSLGNLAGCCAIAGLTAFKRSQARISIRRLDL